MSNPSCELFKSELFFVWVGLKDAVPQNWKWDIKKRLAPLWKYGTPGNIPPTVYFGINLDYVRDKVVDYKYTIYTENISKKL